MRGGGGVAANGGNIGDQLITYELSPQQVSYENIMYYIIVKHIDILHTGIWHIPICIVWHKGIKGGFRGIWAYGQFPYGMVCMVWYGNYPAGVLDRYQSAP